MPHRIFFSNKKELTPLLTAWGYKRFEPNDWDSDSYEEWIYDRGETNRVLKISLNVFDENGKLKIFTPDEWDNDWVISYEPEPPPYVPDDDLPF